MQEREARLFPPRSQRSRFALSSHFALEFNFPLPPLCTPAMQGEVFMTVFTLVATGVAKTNGVNKANGRKRFSNDSVKRDALNGTGE